MDLISTNTSEMGDSMEASCLPKPSAPLSGFTEKEGAAEEPASSSTACGMTTDEEEENDDDDDNDSLHSDIGVDGGHAASSVSVVQRADGCVNVPSQPGTAQGFTLPNTAAAESHISTQEELEQAQVKEDDYITGIRSSPLSSDSEGPLRSLQDALVDVKVPATVSYDSRNSDADEEPGNQIEDDELIANESLKADGKATGTIACESTVALSPANGMQKPGYGGKDWTAQAASADDNVMSKGSTQHSSTASPSSPARLAPPRTNLHWSVSANGVIPAPPSSLQAGRNFSAPGAFRMYQTGLLQPIEMDGSERAPDPLMIASVDLASPPNASSEMSTPALRSSTSDGNYVVEAQLVQDSSHFDEPRSRRDDLEMCVVEAKPLEEKGVFRVRWKVLCLALLTVVAVALGIGVWLGQREVKSGASQASLAPTISPAILRKQFDASLPQYTLAALKNKSSPQSEAYAWAVSKNGTANVTTVDRLLTRFALATFYHATTFGNATWKDRSGWLTASHECDWFMNGQYSLCLDGETVSELAIQDNGLSGTVPPEVALLRDLKNFDVSSNQLNGTVPLELAKVALLETLILFDNHFEDLSVALDVALQLSNLRVLDLEYNRFIGTLPTADMLAALPALDSFYIGGNTIQGAFPTDYATLPSLTSLLLGELHLIGSLPSAFAKLTDMELLYLYNNTFTGTIPDELLEAWQHSMVQFDLSLNNFTGTISTKFGLMTALTSLCFVENQFTGSLPSELGLLTNLQSLYLESNSFTGTIPSEFAQMSALTRISLSGNQLQGSVPEELCQLKNQNLFSGFILNIDCDLVACDCGCSCLGDVMDHSER